MSPVFSYICRACELVTQQVRSIDDRNNQINCSECGLPMARYYEPTPVHFKGKGFYTNDK